MIYGVIDRYNHEGYTYMSKVFHGLENVQKRYNWLISDYECYPQSSQIMKLFEREYCWLSGDELTDLVKQEDFQWIWGCFCGFRKEIPLDKVLKYPLPSAEDYDGYYQNPISLQHPLSSVEIISCDSSYTLIISENKKITDDYMRHYPMSRELPLVD